MLTQTQQDILLAADRSKYPDDWARTLAACLPPSPHCRGFVDLATHARELEVELERMFVDGVLDAQFRLQQAAEDLADLLRMRNGAGCRRAAEMAALAQSMLPKDALL